MLLDPVAVADRDFKLAVLGPRPPWWHPIQRRRWARLRAVVLAIDVTWAGSLLRCIYTPDEVGQMARRRSPALAAFVATWKSGPR